jgi:hypothetical protein
MKNHQGELILFAVYWTDFSGEVPKAEHAFFPSEEMTTALARTEELRKRQRDGERIGFVTFCSENPNSVGLPGAADVLPGYNWKKRRI